MNNYLSIDIGGTNIKYALLDKAGNIIKKDRVSSTQDKNEFLKKIDKIINSFENLKGIAFCAPGQVLNNIIHFGGSLTYLDGMNFPARYVKLNIPIAVINDGKASVLAESWLGNLKGINNCASLTLGTGIGGGCIINGRLISGTHAQAGELSFMRFNPSPTAHEIAGFTYSAVQMISDVNTMAGNLDIKDGMAAFKVIKSGNKEAVERFNKFCAGIATIIFNMQTVIDVSKYTIGGGISAQPIVIDTINKIYNNLYKNNSLISQTLTRPKISVAKFKNDANLYGALYNLLLQENNEQI